MAGRGRELCPGCGQPLESWWAAWRRSRYERRHPSVPTGTFIPNLYTDQVIAELSRHTAWEQTNGR